MEKFYIITNYTKDDDYAITTRIRKCIESYEKTCILCEKEDYENLRDEMIPEDIDCVLVIGGDGTFIQASRKLFGREIPMLGINMGTLGYLTEVEVQNVESAIKQLVEGDYTIENRMMLYGSASHNIRDVALNDIVVTRRGHLRVIQFNLYVNGEFLNSYKADGIIVSTPTGSTAYNLSAGGPIAAPETRVIIMTPICAHSTNSRPVILPDTSHIEVRIESENEIVAFDGERIVRLQPGDVVKVRRANEMTTFVKLRASSFLETLREKMDDED